MQAETYRLLHWLHGWLAVIGGVGAFLLCFSGAAAVFGEHLLNPWLHPALTRPSATAGDYQRMLDADMQALDGRHFSTLTIRLPGDRHDAYYSVLFSAPANESGDGNSVEFLHAADDFAVTEIREGPSDALTDSPVGGLPAFLRVLHTNFLLPGPWGVIIGGIFGLAMFASLATGMVIHRNLFRELLKLRPGASLLFLRRDLHKLIGAWSLPVLLVLALTGVFASLGIPYFAPASALVKSKGEAGMIFADLIPTVEVDAHATVSDQSFRLSDALQLIGGQQPTPEIERIVINDIASGRDLLTVRTIQSGRLCNPAFSFHAATGELLRTGCSFGSYESMPMTLLNMSVPLHIGSLGKPAIPILWTLVGIAGAALSWLGLLLWAQRRARTAKTAEQELRYVRFGRLSTGLCGGVMLSVMILLPVDLGLYAIGIMDRVDTLVLLFCSLMVTAVWLSQWPARTPILSNPRILWIIAACALATPVLHGALPGVAFNPLRDAHVIATNLLLATIGGACLWIVAGWAPQRNQGAS